MLSGAITMVDVDGLKLPADVFLTLTCQQAFGIHPKQIAWVLHVSSQQTQPLC